MNDVEALPQMMCFAMMLASPNEVALRAYLDTPPLLCYNERSEFINSYLEKSNEGIAIINSERRWRYA